jgi:uncharacterized protein
MKNLSTLDWLALILVLVGGVNWGLKGLLDIDLVATLFGTESAVTRAVYTLVGLAAVYMAAISGKLAKKERENV